MINTVRLLVAFTILALLSRTGQAVHWLDMKMPPIEVDGSLFDVAIELHKIPLRVCIEDVNLSSEPGLNHIHLKVGGVTLREFLDQLTNKEPLVAWEEDYFLMCPLIRIYRKSSLLDPRNPLNIKLKQFSIREDDLIDILHLVYYNSEEFRKAVNPNGVEKGFFGSRIQGISSRRFDIRYSLDVDDFSLRELLNALGCLSVNHGTSWYFWYDNSKEYPSNFMLKKF